MKLPDNGLNADEKDRVTIFVRDRQNENVMTHRRERRGRGDARSNGKRTKNNSRVNGAHGGADAPAGHPIGYEDNGCRRMLMRVKEISVKGTIGENVGTPTHM